LTTGARLRTKAGSEEDGSRVIGGGLEGSGVREGTS